MKDELTNTNNNYPSSEHQNSKVEEYDIEGSQQTYNRGHKNTEIGFLDAIRICIMEKYATFKAVPHEPNSGTSYFSTLYSLYLVLFGWKVLILAIWQKWLGDFT